MNWDEAFDEGSGLEERDFPDSKRVWPGKIRARIGRLHYHPTTGGLYRIVGFTFDSQRERWLILYRSESGGTVFSHLPEDFDREGRFLEVKK